MTSKPPEYLSLIRSISKQIESVPDGLMDFRNICREQGHVRAFDLKEKRAYEIIQNLQRRMIIHPGHYEKFVEILEIIDREDVIKMLPGYHDYKSKDAGNHNTNNNAVVIPVNDDVTNSAPRSTSGQTSGGVTDIELSKLSESIQPDLVRRLGIHLNIPYPVIEKKLSGGHERGNLSMLVHWRKDVQERDQRHQLIQALEEADMGDLVSTCLGEDENHSQKDGGPVNRSSVVSEKILSKLASKMGEGWSQFGIQHLGMIKVDIDHFKHGESSMENQIFKMLYEWRRRNHADATIGKLLDLMEASRYISPDSFSFIQEEVDSTV